MNREILFRGKDIKNGAWVEGYYTLYSRSSDGVHPAIITGTEKNCMIPVFIDIETLGQFTGLTDRNGKKIFERDIVRVSDSCLEKNYFFCVEYGVCGGIKNVDYTVGYMGFYLSAANQETRKDVKRGLRTDICFWIFDNECNCEVIGNVYDNPEMVEEYKDV